MMHLIYIHSHYPFPPSPTDPLSSSQFVPLMLYLLWVFVVCLYVWWPGELHQGCLQKREWCIVYRSIAVSTSLKSLPPPASVHCVNPRGRWGLVTQSSAGKHSCPELEWPWHSWQPTFHTIHPPSPGSSCPSSMVFPDPWGKGWYWCLLYSWAFHYQLF